MKASVLHNAIGQIDDDLIEAVGILRDKKPKRRIPYFRAASIAACLCAVCGILLVLHILRPISADGTPPNNTAEHAQAENTSEGFYAGVTIPEMKIEIGKDQNAVADMIAFFLYEGRSYVYFDTVESNPALAETYLGTSDGTIDEWTEEDGYTDFSGSVSGDIYTVSGYDPAFMLCIKEADDVVSVYINNNGISFMYGAELFEDRLHLSDGIKSVSYQSRNDWFYDIGQPKVYSEPADQSTAESASEEPETQTVLSAFLDALNHGTFLYTDDIPLSDGADNVYDACEIWHLFLETDTGITVHLRLFRGGYVMLSELFSVCVKIDEAAFDAIISVFEKG